MYVVTSYVEKWMHVVKIDVDACCKDVHRLKYVIMYVIDV